MCSIARLAPTSQADGGSSTSQSCTFVPTSSFPTLRDGAVKRCQRHSWLVDPVAKTLEFYRLEHGSWLLVKVFADEVMVRAEPFDAIELDLSRWWMP